MKAHCEKIKDVKVLIKSAWEKGDRDEVFKLVGDIQIHCAITDAINYSAVQFSDID